MDEQNAMKSLVVPGDLDALATIRRYVQAAAEQASLEKQQAYRLGLAVDELATNIVTHGYADSAAAGPIEVQATIDAHTLKITLEDTAHPFDPTQQDTPADLDMPLDERGIGGLGIFLALNGIDDFTYERVDNRNRNTLVVYRPASEVSP